jgi:hypothetical protein
LLSELSVDNAVLHELHYSLNEVKHIFSIEVHWKNLDKIINGAVRIHRSLGYFNHTRHLRHAREIFMTFLTPYMSCMVYFF